MNELLVAAPALKIATSNQQSSTLPATSTNTTNYKTSTSNKEIITQEIDYSKLLTKKEAENLMTKSEYQNLRNELLTIKEELKNKPNNNYQVPVISASTNSTAKKGKWVLFGRRNPVQIDTVYSKGSTATNTITKTDVKIVRDTIYLDKIVEKEVVKIIRDTVVNTVTNNIEKTTFVPKVETKIEYVKQELMNLPPDVILFDMGQFFIKKQYNARLDFYAMQLKKYPEIKVQLTGHTDKTGNVEKNKILSKNRANAVRNYLQMKGVNKDRITMEGFGSEAPVSNDKTANGKTQNRRVDIQFVQ
jgi:outer membrane protein OmpA-like peptidoglycan-associated protein